MVASIGVIAPPSQYASYDERGVRRERRSYAQGGPAAGPAMAWRSPGSRSLTRAQMTVASSYAKGDTVIFNRPYKTLGVTAGDERRWGCVDLADGHGQIAKGVLERLATAKGGIEIYRGRRWSFEPAIVRTGRATILPPASSTALCDGGAHRLGRRPLPPGGWFRDQTR